MAKRTTAAREQHKTYKVVYPYGLNLRVEPSKQAAIVRTLKAGETVAERAAKAPDGWLAVDGGFVMREFVE